MRLTSTECPINIYNFNSASVQTKDRVTTNVPDKRVAHTSESRTPPTFSTFTSVQLNHLLEHSIYIATVD
jgi:hypothetical protein